MTKAACVTLSLVSALAVSCGENSTLTAFSASPEELPATESPNSPAQAAGYVKEVLTGGTSDAFRQPWMAVLGDGVASGFLADGQLENGTPEALRALLRTDVSSFIGGESLSRKAIQSRYGRSELSAYSGQSPWSHASQLKALSGGSEVKVFATATVGDGVGGVSRQLEQLKISYDATTPKRVASYVIFQAGSADFCAGAPVETFRSQFADALFRLTQLHPQSVVLVVPIPDVVSAIEGSFGESTLLTVETPVGEVPLTCQAVRTLLQTCPAQRLGEEARADWGAFNEAISSAVAERQSSFAGKLVYAEKVADLVGAESKDLSLDCLHPSLLGQEKLARLTWESVAQELSK